MTKGGLEGGCDTRAPPNFGDKVQHKGEGTGYREEGTEGARRGIGYNTGEKGLLPFELSKELRQ